MLIHLGPTGQETLFSQLSVPHWSQDLVLVLAQALPHSSWPCSRAVMLRTWPYWTSPRGKPQNVQTPGGRQARDEGTLDSGVRSREDGV